MEFEWDETKRKATLEKHGIDFVDMVEVLVGPHLLLEARSDVEHRQTAVGAFHGVTYAVIFTRRGENLRIITARRTRKNEREKYQAFLSGRDPEDER